MSPQITLPRHLPKRKEIMAEDAHYQAQWYESPESVESSRAATPTEELWNKTAPFKDLVSALNDAARWTQEGHYKTTRVVQFDDEGNPITVVWMSVWMGNTVADQEVAGTSAGKAGESIKLMVWMHRDWGPPDHWAWWDSLTKAGLNSNQWDLVYGREVDRRGKEILWSIRLNLWAPDDWTPCINWNWWKWLGYDKKKEFDKVEPVRAHPIEPRGFPEGVEVVECYNCHKRTARKDAWYSWDDSFDEYVPYCSCLCIDQQHDTDVTRTMPDGTELEDEPCCVWEMEKEEAVA